MCIHLYINQELMMGRFLQMNIVKTIMIKLQNVSYNMG